MIEEAFKLIAEPEGESVYLRLSTRSLRQPDRSDENWRDAGEQAA